MTTTPRQTMDFFEHQDRAKARSTKFITLYAISIALICTILGTAAAFIAVTLSDAPSNQSIPVAIAAALLAAGSAAALILGGSMYRIASLKGGGSTVARGLGGILIDPSTRDPQQRQLLNIVDEMAIASGVPVPPVYIMTNQKGINAFAAGYTPGDAVIGVTQGCVDGLKRDELQGVIAHEFSHILNGDMKINIRMIGFLYGILLLTIIGRILIQVAPRTGRSKEAAGGMLAIFALAIFMLILGSLGALAAKIIQASVSRQREFLADASAVQFTRNPEGIANALRRLGAKPSTPRVRHPRVEESSHMFFGQALKLGASLATHPPLKDRIKRINPQWDGTFLPPLPPKVETGETQEQAKPKSAQDRLRDQLNNRMGIPIPGPLADAVDGAIPNSIEHAALLTPLLALSGNMTPSHIDHARDIIQSIPAPLKEAAHDISSSRAVVYALLLDDKDARVHTKQLHHLRDHADPAVSKLTEQLASAATSLSPQLRLPLLDMTLASLAHISDRQHQTFQSNVSALINMDSAVTLFEWVTIKVLTRHLNQRFAAIPRARTQYYALNKLTAEVSVLISIIARTENQTTSTDQAESKAESETHAAQAVTLANTAFAPKKKSNTKPPSSSSPFQATLLPESQCTLDHLNAALDTLNTATPRLKRSIIHACALAAASDHTITTTEAELLRAIADTLSVPIPPLLPNQQLA